MVLFDTYHLGWISRLDCEDIKYEYVLVTINLLVSLRSTLYKYIYALRRFADRSVRNALSCSRHIYRRQSMANLIFHFPMPSLAGAPARQRLNNVYVFAL